MWEVILLKVMLEKSLEEIELVDTKFFNYEVEIGWDLTMHCNYSCSYCNSFNNLGPTHILPLKKYIDAIDFLKSYLGNKKARIILCGGEPTLFKDWNLLMNELQNKEFQPTIITNLALSKKSFYKKFSDLEVKSCIDVSWHPQFANSNDLIEKINFLEENKFLRTVSILADTRYWETVKKAYESVKHIKGVSLSIIKNEKASEIEIASGLYEYSQEQIDYINKSNNVSNESEFKTNILFTNQDSINLTSITEFFELGLTNFKGMNCEIGTTSFQIRPNGDIFPSACMMNYPKAVIGNIFKKKIKKISRPVKCPFDFCGCGPDLRLKKYKG